MAVPVRGGAGEEESVNWFDIARKYTENWYHTQQIFEATGRPSSIMTQRLFHPCLDTFQGEAGGNCYILKEADA